MAKESTEKSKKVTRKTSERKVTKEEFDIEEIKRDLIDYMEMRIDKATQRAIDKSTKKLIRHKNIIILKRDITILVLLIVCFFLGYNLYNISNINIDITTDKKGEKTVEKVDKKDSDEKEDKLKELKEKYAPLIEDIYLNEKSSYLDDFYEGNLTDEAKLYICLNSMDESKITSEDGTVYLDSSDLASIYNSVFDGEYSPKSFKYGNLNFKYLASKELFIADGEFKRASTNILREVVNVDIKDSEIEVSTVEGLVKDNKLYNILSNEEIKNYDGKGLNNYSKSLTGVIYSFTASSDDYKFSGLKIEKL